LKLTVRWRQLPEDVRKHLSERIADRRIAESDLYKLRTWLEQEPDVPAGEWYKDLPTFRLAGRGNLILTFLTLNQIPNGAIVID
jgi:hypothetical protein